MSDAFLDMNTTTALKTLICVNGWSIEELKRTWADSIGGLTVIRVRKGLALWSIGYYNNDYKLVDVNEGLIYNIFNQNLDIPTEISFFLWSML